MHDAIAYMQGLSPCRVLFVGDLSRTWYEDLDVLFSVMEILKDNTRCEVVRAAPAGFDLWVDTYATGLGLPQVYVHPMRKDNVGRWIREVEALELADVVVAFPRETAQKMDEDGFPLKGKAVRHDLRTADEEIVDAALRANVPMLVVFRNGATEWITGEHT